MVGGGARPAPHASAENRQKRGDAEIINYLQDTAGARNLAFGLAVTHDRYGSSAQSHLSSLLTHLCVVQNSRVRVYCRYALLLLGVVDSHGRGEFLRPPLGLWTLEFSLSSRSR